MDLEEPVGVHHRHPLLICGKGQEGHHQLLGFPATPSYKVLNYVPVLLLFIVCDTSKMEEL